MSRDQQDSQEPADHLLLRTLSLCLAFSAFRICSVYVSPVAYRMWQDGVLALTGGPFIVLGLFYMKIRPDRMLCQVCLGFGIPLFCQVCACEFGNIPFHLGSSFALQDAHLAAIDRALGFCWPCTLRWFDRHATANAIGGYFYHSILLQPVILSGMLIARRDLDRLCTYFLAYNLAYFATNIVAYRFPALGVYEYFHLSASDHPNIGMRFTNQMTLPITMLRQGYLARAFTEQQILISFPSFHAVLACLFTWCAWNSRARWLFVLINAAMLAATPIQGSHYLVDVIAGLALGALSIAAAHRIVSGWKASHRRRRRVWIGPAALDPQTRDRPVAAGRTP